MLARRCAETAYEEGAGIVELQPRDLHVQKARIKAQAGNDVALGAVPGWTGAWEDSFLRDKWALLALESFDDIGLMADLDPRAVAVFDRLQLEKVKRYRDGMMSHLFPWCVAGVPGDGWAGRVLGKGKDAVDLWRILQPILLLDRSDPVSAWKEKADTLGERREALDSLNLDSLEFQDEGTDLHVGLLRTSRWIGGGRTRGGRSFMPNIPTEEVFTTPDRRRCDGTVRTTRPVEIRGTVVEDARLEFKNGVLVNFDASRGRDAMAAYLETDEGSRRLGEVALVDETSSIAKSGLIFDSILYDENASCHIALGAGYPSCLSNGSDLTDGETKVAAGCNHSTVHRDFMIGSPSTQVTGIRGNGSEVTILREGRFVI